MIESLKKKIKSLVISPIRVFLFLLIFVFLTPLYMYFSDDPGKLNDSYPHLLFDENQELVIQWKKEKPKSWVTLKQVSKYGKWAIILSEDWSFFSHQGIDVDELKKAIDESLKEKRIKRGASTISQQLVKNVFLSHSRSLWRKMHELILTHRMEKIVSKEKILEFYLNVIEFGPNIYGIKNASYHYFKKHPHQMNPREAAFLAMLLPSPKRYYISYQQKRLTNYARTRVKINLKKMKMAQIISEDERVYWTNEKIFWER